MTAPTGPSCQIGVVVMAYGTPEGADDVEAFYTDVRRGRPPSPEQLADLRRRYDAIGGLSPLAARTRAQVSGIQAALDELSPGGYRAVLGNKHSSPRIEEAVDLLAGKGVEAAVGLVLAPHYSALSVGEYGSRFAERASEHGMATTVVESWHDLPVLIELLAERVMAARDELADSLVEVVFTAHSLPARILESGDPYPAQLEATATAVAERAGIERWRTGWQSAGRTPEPWLGPDLREVLHTLAGEGAGGVVVCPAGFTSDHLEVLYDVDIEAKAVAEELGLGLVRTASLNDDPALCLGLAQLVQSATVALGRGTEG
jgi:protoporphyrin/coproporphyrin ferrochelatase